MSDSNNDLNDPAFNDTWENLITSYSLFMAATNQPMRFRDFIEYARRIHRRGVHLYLPGHGWMDALYVDDQNEWRVIPAQLALNQGMIALSLFQMAHPNGLSLSSETLFKNHLIRKRLRQFYRNLDQVLFKKTE